MIFDRNIARYCIGPGLSLKAALRHMDREKLRILLCTNERGELSGVVTPGDVNRWLIADHANTLTVPVADVCNRNPCVLPEGSASRRIDQNLDRFPFIPLVDERNRPVALAMRRHLHKGIQLGDFRLEEAGSTFVIAEIGNNHNGKLDTALRLIDCAKEAGADCAKLQMRDMGALYASAGRAEDPRGNLGTQYTLDLLHRFQLSLEEFNKVFDHCQDLGLIPLCTPWDEPSVIRLEEYGLPAYKIASADLTNHKLVKAVINTNKPLICSTGMAREAEIVETVRLLQRSGSAYVLLHCNSTYPTPFKDINLAYLNRLKEIGECMVGYSGHERDIFVPVAAVALGAKVIEKHLTIDRSMEGSDHKISLLPGEFARMVEGIRQVEQSMDTVRTRQPSQGELMNRANLAKSVFASCDIAKGQNIESSMLDVRSPGHGLQPNRMTELIGLTAPRDMRRGDVFYSADVDGGSVKPRSFDFKNAWGLPVRHHDYHKFIAASNPRLLEFHLSYRDLELEHASFFEGPLPLRLVVHAPELFAGDHILDLTSPDETYRQHSIQQMRQVIEVTKRLRVFFKDVEGSVGIVANIGGFSQDEPLSQNHCEQRLELLLRSLSALEDPDIELWPQTMPPFPWHFGGQRFHNLFLRPSDIARFCSVNKRRVCLDVSHSKLACNHFGWSFQRFLEQVLPYTAHLHLADASGVDGEGLQIGEGEIDFYAVSAAIQTYAPTASWIPEIWQGHENNGEGFWIALDRLEKSGMGGPSRCVPGDSES